MNGYGGCLSTVAAGINTDGCQITSSTVYLIDRPHGPRHTDAESGSEVFLSHSSRMDFHCLLLIRPRVLIFQHRTHANWQQAHAFRYNQEEWARVQALICLSSVSGFPEFCAMCFGLGFFFFLERGLRHINSVLPLLPLFKWIDEGRVAVTSTMQIPFYLG